ncbi:MAG: DUF4971 domain-containing protein [Rikenellaceae bacterium]
MDNLFKRLFGAVASLMIIMLFALSCSSSGESVEVEGGDDGSSDSELLLESFVVSIAGGTTTIEAEIDNDARTVKIPGLTQGGSIISVEYTTNVTASFIPSLDNYIGNWSSSFTATLVGAGLTAVYTISLSDYDRGSNNILIVDPANVKQQVLFIGTDMERSQNSMVKASNAQQVAQWCFGDIDFNYCRVSYDRAQEEVEGTPTFDFYDNTLEAMSIIKGVNPNIKWWATLKSDYDGYGTESNLPDWITNGVVNVMVPTTSGYYFYKDKYAKFLYDYLKYFADKGQRIDYMSTGKEWGTFIDIEVAQYVIEYLNEELPKVGIEPPKFSDPSAYGLSSAVTWVNTANTMGIGHLYWGFCSHNYPHTSYNFENLVAAADNLAAVQTNSDGENNFWVIDSETGGGTMGAYSGVDADSEMTSTMLNAFMEKCEFFADGYNGELIFEIFSRNKTSESRAVYFSSNSEATTEAVRLSNYYALKSHGNYFQDGMYYIMAIAENMKDDIYTMQFANEDQMYVAVVNLGETAIDNMLIDLNSKVYNGAVEQHVMDEQTVKVNGDIDGYMVEGKYLSSGQIEVTIPAVSVNFFKIDLEKSDVEDDDTESEDSNKDVTLDDLTSGGDISL